MLTRSSSWLVERRRLRKRRDRARGRAGNVTGVKPEERSDPAFLGLHFCAHSWIDRWLTRQGVSSSAVRESRTVEATQRLSKSSTVRFNSRTARANAQLSFSAEPWEPLCILNVFMSVSIGNPHGRSPFRNGAPILSNAQARSGITGSPSFEQIRGRSPHHGRGHNRLLSITTRTISFAYNINTISRLEYGSSVRTGSR